MACDILDLQCIFVNEIFGSMILAAIGGAILYFMIMGRLRLGAELTLAVAVPILLVLTLMVGGFQPVYAFITVIVALMLAFVFQKIIGNR